MSSIQKTARGYRAQVFVSGRRDSSTFRTRSEAVAWGRRRETELAAVDVGEAADQFTVRDALKRYRDEIAPTKRGHQFERVRLTAFLDPAKDALLPLSKRLRDLVPEDFRAWREDRVLRVQTSTVLREMGLLSAVFTTARREWRWMGENPLADVRRPRAPDHRDVIIHDWQVRRMLRALGWSPHCVVREVRQAVACCFLLALRSGMRAGEITGLTWDRVHADYVFLDQTKTVPRDVPLSRQARRVIDQMRGYDERFVFGVTARSMDALFRKYRARAGLAGFTFHDARHTAATMLAGKLDVLTLCKVFGWKSTKQALTYYNPSASDIARRLDSTR